MKNGHQKLDLSVRFPYFDSFIVFKGAGGDDVVRRVARAAKDDVRVAFERLYDLLGLQVPYVYQMILASADDPLATGDREVCEYTVLIVLVTRICLQAFAFTVVPQFERVVECGSEDILSVGREANE